MSQRPWLDFDLSEIKLNIDPYRFEPLLSMYELTELIRVHSNLNNSLQRSEIYQIRKIITVKYGYSEVTGGIQKQFHNIPKIPNSKFSIDDSKLCLVDLIYFCPEMIR
ncbi:hypothetical protein BpHYR1_031654 [Brachionus plicatilis]|uniref:Uncharacterized protein n=1 Tax=Brachionus plicatilis TaxID=10195 RepID=A0A3M7SGY6_BRAPC|nr:hypothetical protein BpHYR1_031654 [Brachionus plicatilis]